MNAVEVNFTEMEEKRMNESLELGEDKMSGDLNDLNQAEQIIKKLTWRFRKMPKRKSTVPWSLPVEIWLMLLNPGRSFASKKGLGFLHGKTA